MRSTVFVLVVCTVMVGAPLSAHSAYTTETAVTPDDEGTPTVGRQVSVPPEAKSAAGSSGGEGHLDITRKYDSAGRLILETDVTRGLTDSYEYEDVLGRLTKHTRTVKSGSTTLTLTETRSYDDSKHQIAVHRVIGTGNAASPQRTEDYTETTDTLGRVLSVSRTVDGQPAIDTYMYGPRGQVLTHTSPTKALTTLDYDPQGNLVKRTNASGYVTSYTLDALGRVVTETGPPAGFTRTLAYDARGRLLSDTVATEGATPELEKGYAYDTGAQQVVETESVEGKAITTTRTYDGRGRLVRQSIQGGGGESPLVEAHEFDGPWTKRATTTEGSWELDALSQRDDLGRPLTTEEQWASEDKGYDYEAQYTWAGNSADVAFHDEMGDDSKDYAASLGLD